MKKVTIIILALFILGCKEVNKMSKDIVEDSNVYKLKDIPVNSVKKYDDTYLFYIRFSNLIYNVNGKEIKIPIFNGDLKDARYDDLLRYCTDKGTLKSNTNISGFIVDTNKGELKKTLLEFIKFYKGNVLKGYEKPFTVFTMGDDHYVKEFYFVYHFFVKDVPFELMILFDAKDEWHGDYGYKELESISLEDLTPIEYEEPGFSYSFSIGEYFIKD